MRQLVGLLIAVAPLLAAEENRAGKELFERRCGACHAIDTIKAGPPLRGVVNRQAGSLAGFPYSDALASKKIRWDRPTLDRWLTDPDSVAPGSDMAFRLENRLERARIIDYLQQLK